MIAGLQLDDALLEQQRQAYAVKGVDESEPAQQPKKRKQVYVNGEEVSGPQYNIDMVQLRQCTGNWWSSSNHQES